MWFKKKSVLQTEGHYDTEKSADGTTDMRTIYKDYTYFSSSITNSGLPSAAAAGNYFYLPGLAYYVSGQLYGVGYGGGYWSSSADPRDDKFAYALIFDSGSVRVDYNICKSGFRVGGFE